ncbi:MAG: MerR family redox-sensitive transcriptional activator SoxR [Parasphingorhabdus sp.]|jgi:MerR family redox-sensitive transcriptional activator SoxR
MKIGDVTNKLGLSISKIRYYEKTGLIQAPPRISGKRVFSSDVITAIQFVQLSQAAGFTNKEIRVLLENALDKPVDKGLFAPLVKEKRCEVQARIKSLQIMDDLLAEMMSCRCRSLQDCVQIATDRSHLSATL